MTRFAMLSCLLGCLLLAACNPTPAEKPLQYNSKPLDLQAPGYRLVPHPLHNPQKLAEILQPLVNYLNQSAPEAHIALESSRDYQAFEKKFRAREGEILMPNPWQAIQAMHAGYHVIAMWGKAEDFKGLFIVRKDGGIQKPADLIGKTVSYPSPTAFAAGVMSQYFLHTHGIDINKDIQNAYVGSQESSIMNVFLKQSAAGATWPPPWRMFQKEHPSEAAELQVAWETPHLVNNAVMLRDDVPAATGQKILKALLSLQDTPEGKKILAGMETDRFYAAKDADYDVVRQYITRFEKEVRPVERK